MIPNPHKIQKGGQDAYFNNQNLLVIADGVGGWNQYGIDQSKYSKFLCRAKVYFNEDHQFYSQYPLELIKKAYQKNKYIGSSTMIVLTLFEDFLHTCYIGDSSFIVIRIYDQLTPVIIHKSTQQQHSFNFPFQLSLKKYNGDTPQSSICINIKIQQNDIIIAGSDGLFDNLFVQEILITIKEILQDESNINQKYFQKQLLNLAKIFAEQAIQRGKNQQFQSPFQLHAKQLGIKYKGGKLDDTTVIIALIQKIIKQQYQNIEQYL